MLVGSESLFFLGIRQSEYRGSAMEALSPKQKEIRQLQHDLLQTLFAQSPRKCPIGGLPPQQQWLSTRQLANAVNVGVYRARRLLLDLVSRKK
ncbi:hypothetical protein M5585_21795 [Serratia ureilytica]